jgi:signal transduction histidine kinase
MRASMPYNHVVARTIGVLALGLEEGLLEEVREELDDAGFSLVAESAESNLGGLERCDAVLLDDSAGQPAWRDRLEKIHRTRPELAIVLVTADPSSLWVTGALRNRRLFQAVSRKMNPGELLAACLAAHEVTALRRDSAEQRRTAQRRVEVMATLHELTAATTELGSYAEVLEHVTRDLHRLVRLDLAAMLAALDGPAAVLHLHCQDACDVTLVRAVRDKCLESFRAAAGRSIDESQLTMNLSGRPVLTAGPVARPPVTTQIPLVSAGDTIGLLFLSSSDSEPLSNEERRVLYLLANRTADTLVRLKIRLGDERRRLTMMVESMADGLILTDTHSEKVLINPAARRLLGIEGVQPITQHFLKETLGFYPFDLVATEGGAATVREEVRIADKTLHSMVSPVRDAAGKLEGVVVVLRDFTEARAFARRQAEFVSAVSHELRSPLTSITGALDIVLSEYAGRLSEKQRRYAQLARDSCTKLNQVVDDLLDVARSERGRMPVSLTPILLDELGRDAVERFRPAAQQKRVTLECKTVGSAIRIMGDPDRLSQVLSNLLSNAIKFTPEGGLVEVELFGPSVASTHVGVAVFNNGEPIPEEARERIFEKFERLDPGDRQVGGTGLGLAISRAIVEAHGGRIWALNRPDGGAAFRFVLPIGGEPPPIDPARH